MELNLRDYLKIIWKRAWLIAAVVTISCIAAGVVSKFYIQPVYEATNKMIVAKSKAAPAEQQLDINTLNFNILLIDSYKEIIRTPAILDVVLSQHPEFNLTIDQLNRKLQVSSISATQIITLVIKDNSYTRAAEIVNAIAAAFRSKIPSIINVDNVSTISEAKLSDNPLPVTPNIQLNITIGFLVSFILIFALIMLIEYLDDTVKTEEDIERLLGTPTLSMIAKFKKRDFNSPKSKLIKEKAGETNVSIL